jgi:hypothetical protein
MIVHRACPDDDAQAKGLSGLGIPEAGGQSGCAGRLHVLLARESRWIETVTLDWGGRFVGALEWRFEIGGRDRGREG